MGGHRVRAVKDTAAAVAAMVALTGSEAPGAVPARGLGVGTESPWGRRCATWSGSTRRVAELLGIS
ncbi:hypothetical protein BJ965_000046 [Streptomyces luteogriseus]|uniref:Uncharacterized protein n=1 Tax=Streptomyces luteogriseus TaxID=68233 RepID=A0A7W7GEL1_9ACTN|nr:hypothetical protein [Streptomyces luteogriseus]